MAKNTNKWKKVCDRIKTTMNLSERKFERGEATLILSNLGWNDFTGNLEEQYIIRDHAKGYKPDFALIPKGQEMPGIYVELKKTEHKQREKDVLQINTYMMLSNCRFCIYLGEKMELFYIKIENNGKLRTLKSVISLEYNPNNPEGNRLLDLIAYETFDEDKLAQFCEDRIAADEAANFFITDEGRKRLFKLIAKDRKLSKGAAAFLPTLLSLPKQKLQTVETIEDEPETTLPPSEHNPNGDVDVDKAIGQFREFALKSVGTNSVRNYIRHLKDNVSRYISKITDNKVKSAFYVTNSKDLKNYIKTLKADKDFVAFNKENKYFLTASLSKYLEYLEDAEETTSHPTPEIDAEGGYLVFKMKMPNSGVDATLHFYRDKKKYVIKAGSLISKKKGTSLVGGMKNFHDEFIKGKKVKEQDDSYVMLEDAIIPEGNNSPSGAARFCAGSSRPGTTDWEDLDGKKYPKEWWQGKE